MMERVEMEAVLEAILFVSSEPVPRGRLLDLFGDDEREVATAALEAVLARYSADSTGDRGEGAENSGNGAGRGIMAEEVAGGVRLVTRPEMVSYLRRFFDVAGGTKLSMASLETLAIIAYRQPITGPEIQELRSVSPVGVVKTLLERRLVRIVGRKEVVGKPFLYGTTREFLVHFGLNSLKDLPPLEEFEETFGSMLEGGGAGDRGEMGEAGESGAGGAEGAGGEDREEEILRQAAALEEAAADAPDDPEAADTPEVAESAEAEEGSAADSPLADEVEV